MARTALTVRVALGLVLGACSGRADDPALTVVAAAVESPGVMRREPYADTLHGEIIPDSLRWMEDTSHQDVRAFVASQTAYTNAVLARLVNVEALQRTVDTAMAHTPTLDVVSPAAGRLFLTRWFGANPSLVVADSGSTAERVLLSADTLAARYDGAGLRAISPSADGRYVAVGATTNGDERAMILIIDATTGRILPDVIPDLLTTTAGTRYQVSWLPDGRGFFYPRLWPGSTTGPAVDRLARGRQFLHILGTPQSADVPVFGFDVARDVPMEKADLPTRVLATPGSRWLIASLTRVKEPGSALYVASWDATSQRALSWRLVAASRENISQSHVRGDTLYAISRNPSDRGAIVRTVLRDTGTHTWTTVVPEQRGVIVAFAAQRDAIYFTERVDGAPVLRRVRYGQTTITTITTPSGESVRLQRGAADRTGVAFFSDAWATPPHWQQVVDESGRVASLPIDDGHNDHTTGRVTSASLQATSKDGTRVPVSLVYGDAALRNGALDGSAPLLIEAYGGYGNANDPSFNPFVLAWTALGGVYAWVHVRGGGELGDAWHTAAMREHKQRTFDDMIGAIEALIAKRYTSAGRVTVTGTSFGANIPGMVLLQRPELLGAALFEVGQPDEIRGAMLDPTAARNIGELGDLDTPEGIRLLQRASPYHMVPQRVALPAVLVHSASGDYNFGSSMVIGKYVARLQAANTGTRPVIWVQTDGGHRALIGHSPAWAAKAFAFALWQSAVPAYQPAPAVRPTP